MNSSPEFDPYSIERPDPTLLKYYGLASLLAGPLFPIAFLPQWFRYITLQYKFDESGVSMKWGILFRKEVYLTYRRIQDIHLTRNVVQRWMGLAKISLQTASGSSEAEMVIEGILEAEELRDFLYSRMRGARNDTAETANSSEEDADQTGPSEADRATEALVGIRDAMQRLVEQKETQA